MHQDLSANFLKTYSRSSWHSVLLILIALFWSWPFKASCQEFEIGLIGGGSYYLGDLNPGTHFQNMQLAYGLEARYNINTRWAVKLSGIRGKIKGSSSQSKFLPDRDLSFESNITDVSAVAEFNFLEYFVGSRRHFITPYIYAGVCLYFFNPMSGGVALHSIGTEGQNVEGGKKLYSLWGIGVPFGLGAKFTLSRKVGFTVFWEMHKTFTDYLDDVSTTYYLNGPTINPDDPAQLLSDPTRSHQPGMQRGNAKNMDWYAFAGLSISYRFDLQGSKKCRDQKFK